MTTKGYEEDPGKIEAKIVHKDAARKKTVDVEDIQEIDQMNASGRFFLPDILARIFLHNIEKIFVHIFFNVKK